MMQMVGSFAEFERAMIRERTLAGVAAARAEGRVDGQRPTLTEAQRADVAENVTSGRRTAAICGVPGTGAAIGNNLNG